MRKKIIFYINTIGKGGAERVITQLAEHFLRAGNEVILVTSCRAKEEYNVAEGVCRIILEEEKVSRSFFVRNLTRIAKLRKLCKIMKPNVLISFTKEPNLRAIFATIGLPVKTIVSVRNDPNRAYAGLAGWVVGKFVLPLADGCVFQTEEAKQWFSKKMKKKSVVIMNEVSSAFFSTQRRNPKNIISIGRLTSQKNHWMLIHAFNQIAVKFPDQNLLIYGSGTLEDKLRNEIQSLGMENRVFLMGSTSNVQDVLAQASVFVLSSDYEGMPNALMEALAVGVPCISTDCPCGGPDALIQNEKNGLLVPVGDENAMAAAMDKLLSDPVRAEKMGKQAREDAKRYEPGKIFEEWKNYVEAVANYESRK